VLFRSAAARNQTLTTRKGDYPIIETPTLLVWGEADIALDIATIDGTDRYVRDLMVRRLPGISHWVQNDAADEVNTILRDWLTAGR